jgi:two-component sensor histidine kinase
MRILIVDDDPDFRSLAARALRREFPDAELVEVADRAGLDRVLAYPAPVGLLVSDLDLVWTDGFEVLEAVRAAHPLCPAIMFTGTGNEEAAVRAIKAGFDDYVVKSPKRLRHLAASAHAAVTRAETRRGLEANRDILTQELYHRLHNNLQLVVGLIAFTARDVADPAARAKLDDLGRRVQSLSLLQERLYRGGDYGRVDLGGFLRDLAEDLLALDGRGLSAELEAEAPPIAVNVAVPLALIANELITNALKHGNLNAAAAPIRIALRCQPDEGCILEVENDGGQIAVPGPAAGGPAPADGLGLRLVHRLAQQIGAAVEIGAAGNGGRRCRVTVPPPRPGG